MARKSVKGRKAHIDWLLGEARHMARTRDVIDAWARRLTEMGLPIWRMMVGIRVIHPQILATNYVWQGGTRSTAVRRGYDFQRESDYLTSPIKRIHDGAAQVRSRIETRKRRSPMPVIAELKDQGATDYLALPLVFSDRTRNLISFATKATGGFKPHHIAFLKEILPVVTMILESQTDKRVAATLLDTYVGHQAGERILKGDIQRGEGELIRAVIWSGDLRNFTAMSNTLPLDEVIGILNEYFEHMTEAIHSHQGQVLKFIGDGVLAIFPLGDAAFTHYSCRNALAAAIETEQAIDALNVAREAAGKSPLKFGLGLHVGDIMFGNIGALDRLDFTAIGPSVNLTARLENLAASLEIPLVMSREFATVAGEYSEIVSLGRHDLRGVGAPQEVFTLPQFAPARPHPTGPEAQVLA